MNATNAEKMFYNWLDSNQDVVCKELTNGEIYIGLDVSDAPAGKVIKRARLEEVASQEGLHRNFGLTLYLMVIIFITAVLILIMAKP